MTRYFFLLIGFILALSSFSRAESIPLFTQKYLRTSEKPNLYTATIDNCNPGATYNLVVINGQNGEDVISSASIVLNGVEVVRENEFNQRVGMVEKTVTLQSENTLDIRLASGPGGFITVNIFCSANCPGVEITSPDDGSTINRSKAMVRGSLYNVSGETGASVTNDGASFMLEVHGAGFAGKVPLHVGVNTITATATDACGLKAKDTITISADSIEEPVRLTAVPSSGIPSVSTGAFTVTFEADAYVPNPVANYSWDFNGDGIVDESGSGLSEVTTGYEQTGLYFPSVTVTDTLGNAYTETTVVNVLSRDEMDNLLKGRWEGMRGKLTGGDVEGALKFFVRGSQDSYRQAFTEPGKNLADIFSNIDEIKLHTLKGQVAECGAVRIENGIPYSYPISFVRDENGIWKILGF